MAFAIPGLRNTCADPHELLPSDTFHPASTTETDLYNTNCHALAAGQHIRLEQDIVADEGDRSDQNQLPPITRMFLPALRTHGAYLVDNTGGFIFYAEDIRTGVLHRTGEEVNTLIGRPLDSPLPGGGTVWRVVIERSS